MNLVQLISFIGYISNAVGSGVQIKKYADDDKSPTKFVYLLCEINFDNQSETLNHHEYPSRERDNTLSSYYIVLQTPSNKSNLKLRCNQSDTISSQYLVVVNPKKVNLNDGRPNDQQNYVAIYFNTNSDSRLCTVERIPNITYGSKNGLSIFIENQYLRNNNNFELRSGGLLFCCQRKYFEKIRKVNLTSFFKYNPQEKTLQVDLSYQFSNFELCNLFKHIYDYIVHIKVPERQKEELPLFIEEHNDVVAKNQLPSVIRTINLEGNTSKTAVDFLSSRKQKLPDSYQSVNEGFSRVIRSLNRPLVLQYFDTKGLLIKDKENAFQFPSTEQKQTNANEIGKTVNSVAVTLGKTHLRHHGGKRRKVAVRVLGVEGSSSLLPCDVSSQVQNDSPLLLMWFKEASHTPLFSVDFREKTSSGVPHIGRDLTSSITQRAQLHVTRESSFYTSSFVRSSNHTPEEYKTFTSSGGNLEIQLTERSDEGIYKCRVDFLHSPSRNERVNLTVIIPPHTLELEWRKNGVWLEPSGEFLEPLILGESLHVVCKASPAWPPPLVIWSSEGIRIDETFEQHPQMSLPTKVLQNNKILTGAVNHLQISSLQRTDHLRKLTCKASNNNLVQATMRSITLSVALPVLLVTLDEPPIIDVGESMDLQCTVWGSYPPPLVKWKLGVQEIKASQLRVSDDGNVTYSVVQLTPSADQDDQPLTCQAYNPILHAHKVPYSIKRTVKKIHVRFAPEVKAQLGKSLNISRIKEGDDVYFECVLRANPPPHILYWIHNGKKLHTRPGVFLTKDTLVIQGVTLADSGNYSCVVINTMGQATSGLVSLMVKFTPVCSKLDTIQWEFSIAKYEQAKINCNLSANPSDVTFQWSFNNTAELVDVPSDRYSSNGSTSVLNYTPMNELDYGTLLCWGSNEVGKQREPCVFHIKAAGKPEPPHNCRVIQATISSLRVTCLPGNDGGDLQIFHLQAQAATVDRRVVAEVSNSSPDFFAANLQPDTKYRLLITAANKRGESHPPKEIVAMTSQLATQRQETNAEATRERKTEKKDQMRVMMGIALAGSVAGLIILVLSVWACVKVRRTRRRQNESTNDIPIDDSTGNKDLVLEEVPIKSKKSEEPIIINAVTNLEASVVPSQILSSTSGAMMLSTVISLDEKPHWKNSSDSLSSEPKYQYSHRIFT